MILLHLTIIFLTLAGTAYSQVTTSSISLKVKAFAKLGDNATLPCRVISKDNMITGTRIVWTKVPDDEEQSEDVLSSMGFHTKTFGRFEDRVFLANEDDEDASLIITNVSMEDTGNYKCEITNGIDDTVQEVILEVQEFIGVVFPYSPYLGRYNLNYDEAEQACLAQGAVVASFEQLFEAWQSGLDWCNAGWLSDGTVQYPITKPREPCGGSHKRPGVRNYGVRNRHISRFDVFCFVSSLKGEFYWLDQPDRLTYDEAVQACLDDGAEIAKVGHIYAAWKLNGFDRCDAGWLADGSVRYPITRPRKNCSPNEAAVRFAGFPDKNQKYGVYCFKAEQPGAR